MAIQIPHIRCQRQQTCPKRAKSLGCHLLGTVRCPAESSPLAHPAQIVLPRQLLLETGPGVTRWLCTWAVRESWFPAVFLVNCGKRDLNLHGRCDSRKMKLRFPASSLALQNSLASLSSKHEEKKTCNMNSHAHRAKDHAIFTVKFEDELLFEIPSV